MNRWIVLVLALLALVCADQCPDGNSCEEGNTCCNTLGDGYECCSFDRAECCEDHVHCCPEGTLCAVEEARCVLNATVHFPWVERLRAQSTQLSKSFRMIKPSDIEDDDNICPDNSQCPSEFSCLKALNRFGCCPLTQGVSCPDGKHCCPEGHRCSADCRSCVKKDIVGAVICRDGKSECPDETTCCEDPDGTWGCCPMPEAVCCEDKLHCCPKYSTCDVKHSKCISMSTRKDIPMWAKLPARNRADWENKQEGAHATKEVISTNNTSEKVPERTTVIPQKEEVSTSPVARADGMDIPCNSTVSCPDKTTCCKTEEGQWSCCPLPEAVCCEDFIHCCPHGKKCNLAAQSCDNSSSSVPWVEKVPAFPWTREQAGDVKCDSTKSCPDDSTCCKTTSGQWACCPLPEAVCCEDFIHCCPHGKKCNLAAQSCDNSSSSVPWVEKVPAFPRTDEKARDVKCDSTKSCPDDSTCCKTTSGQWACCPLPEAVCCEDFIHCCPHGKKCNLAAQSCDNSSSSVPWVEKVPAFPRTDEKARDVKCDSTKSCPGDSTCCKTTSGQWACCPLLKAVCCDDHEHCCPHGTTCDLTSLSCNGPSGSTPMVDKVSAFTTAAPSSPAAATQSQATRVGPEQEARGEVRCDHHTACPDHTTCCLMANKKWGCCPLPKAVCCDDKEHCCPSDYKCNTGRATCVKGEVVIPWYSKVPAITSVEPGVTQGCDSQSNCPLDATCCKLPTGQWGCCPLPEAVCCQDGEHCCPRGYSCNIGWASCQRLTMLQLQRVPLTRLYVPSQLPGATATHVKCDDQFSCKSGETCCKASQSTWGCCPTPNGVCCADLKHCCPSGYACGEAGTCTQDSELRWDNWQVFFSNKRALTL